jgi:ribonuclease P protein component
VSTRFSRTLRLRSRAEYERVQQGGRRHAAKYLVLLARPNDLDHDRLGIIASRRMGGAVLRVHAKRRIRELFRRHEPDLTRQRGLVPMDLVVIPRRELVAAPFAAVAAEYQAMLTKARRSAGAAK